MPGSGRSGFRPTLITSLVAGAALLVLLGLGFWQVERLAWKTELIADLRARAAAPALELPPVFRSEELQYRRVGLAGRFLPEGLLRSAPRNLNKRLGFYFYAPFVLTDGRTILVELGWLPEPAADAAAVPAGRQSFEAILLRDGWRGSAWLKPANDPAKNVWHYVDTREMAAAAGLEIRVAELYAVALPGALPETEFRGRQPGLDVPNNHLEYAITWFALAAILVVIFVLYHRRRAEG
ncbi:MAG: SURF1 family protein [Kiloniellales bacterium]|nr:SURF1 family protein [Kiloniellales bacterium]